MPPSTSTPRQVSATCRAVIRKRFSEYPSKSVLIGHYTVAFSEGQIHRVFRVTSDETALSSFHLVKTLLAGARSGGVPLGEDQ